MSSKVPPHLRPGFESLEGRELMTRGLAITQSPLVVPAVIAPLPGNPFPGTTDPQFPRVARTRLATSANSAATGIAITFMEPMNPTMVGNVANDRVSDPSRVGRSVARTRDLSPSLVPLKSATYQPATSMVTLTTTGPLSPSSTYLVTNRDSFGRLKTAADYQRTPSQLVNYADTSGKPLDGVGIFAVTVPKAHPDGVPLT